MHVQLILDQEGTKRPVPLHGPEAFSAMRRAGRLAAETLDYVTPHVTPGVSTGELDRLIAAFMREHARRARYPRLPRLPQELLHLGQPCRQSRHSKR